MSRFASLCFLLLLSFTSVTNQLQVIVGDKGSSILATIQQPTIELKIQEWGGITFTPKITCNITNTTLSYGYSMASGGSLIAEMSFVSNTGAFTFYSRKGLVGSYPLTMSVIVGDKGSLEKFNVLYNFTITVESSPISTQLPIIMQDNFSDGNISLKDSSLYNGMNWRIINGTVNSDTTQMRLYTDDSFVLSNDELNFNNVTIAFETYTQWSANRGIRFLYLDSNNYYEINLSSAPLKIVRVMNGNSTTLLERNRADILTIHLSNYYASFKVYVLRKDKSITIQFGKLGFGGDFQITVTDQDINAFNKFTKGRFGFFDRTYASPSYARFRLNMVIVVQGKREDIRAPIKYYVDVNNGNDSNIGLSLASSFKTIGRSEAMLLAGDTLYIAPGVYRESVYINGLASKEQPITFKAIQNNTAIIDGSEVLDSTNWTIYSSSPQLIYQYSLGRYTHVLYQDGVLLRTCMKPSPINPDDLFYHGNYLVIKSSDVLSGSERDDVFKDGVEYLVLDDMFRKNPKGENVTDGYWIGGTIYHYSKSMDLIFMKRITAYNATLNRVTVALVSSVSGYYFSASDKYAIADHPGCIKMQGEYASMDGVVYIAPFESKNPSNCVIEATLLERGIQIENSKEGFVIDGLTVRRFTGHGISCDRVCRDITIINSKSVYNFYHGFHTTDAENIYVGFSEFGRNTQNGINLGGFVRETIIESNYIHHNQDNGLWIGNVGPILFYCWNILVKDNVIKYQASYQRHPDNIQMTNVNNVTFVGNYLENIGNQNIWTEQSGVVNYYRNTFVNGMVAFNHAAKPSIYNNIFANSGFRVSPKFDTFVIYSSFAGLPSVVSWSLLIADIQTGNNELANTLIWNKNLNLVNEIKSMAASSAEKNTTVRDEIIDQINSIISDIQFMKKHVDLVLPLLSSSGCATIIWQAILQRGTMDNRGNILKLNVTNEPEVEEVRSLNRAILDELALDARLDKSLINYSPRLLSLMNNVFIDSQLMTPNPSYSFIPYWKIDNNYHNIQNTYQTNLWKALPLGNQTIFMRFSSDLQQQFVNATLLDFHLLPNSTLINAGRDVGLPFYGSAPDIGAFEYYIPPSPKPSLSPFPSSKPSIVPVHSSPGPRYSSPKPSSLKPSFSPKYSSTKPLKSNTYTSHGELL
ncbi:hypothetical protein ABK040_011139 [Willaertia magna]